LPKPAQKFTVAEAVEVLKNYPADAEARGFQNVQIVQQPVRVGALKPDTQTA